MKQLLIASVLCLANQLALAQNLLELRGAPDSKYRYVDWVYIFSNRVAVDVFYIGVPGNNEFNLGGGYQFKLGSLNLTPLLYAVAAKEDGERGLKLAILLNFEKNGWQINSFLAHFAPRKGKVSSYQVLDTLDFSKRINKHWELGISTGFFHQEKKWNPQIGPLLKINDHCGDWGISFRFGQPWEIRITRTFLF